MKSLQKESAGKSMLVVLPDTAATGRNIKRLRQEEGLTINDLQEALGFATPQSIYRWQKGDTGPSVDNLVILSDIFDVAMDEIVVRREI